MTPPNPDSLRQEIDQQTRCVQTLRMQLYSMPDPSADENLQQQLVQAESKLFELQTQCSAEKKETTKEKETSKTGSRGRVLGRDTTGLHVEVVRRMDPLPTGVYHLLDPASEPLLTVDIENASHETRRVLTRAYIEGLSAQAVCTVEIKPKQTETVTLHPTLLPDRTKELTEVQRATLHVVAEDLDGKLESHNTYAITCLARTSSFNGVRWTETGQLVELTRYYGAWVTPYVDPVQERIRRAVEFTPEQRLVGYQASPDEVDSQVEALYQSLREIDIAYVNSVIDYGAPTGVVSQRTRLPRETLATRSANCIDGTVLMASLIEGISLNPAIVVVPGHAFVGWERQFGSDDWSFMETTMIGSHGFNLACESGQRQFKSHEAASTGHLKLHWLSKLRAASIWPIE